MSEKEYICDKHKKIIEENAAEFKTRVEKAKNIDEIYFSLSEETREMVDFFIDECKKTKGAITEDIDKRITVLQDKGCHKVVISFVGIIGQGKKIKSGSNVVIHFDSVK